MDPDPVACERAETNGTGLIEANPALGHIVAFSFQ
jgi:hypothetical protein